VKVPFKARTQAKPPATDFHHRLLARPSHTRSTAARDEARSTSLRSGEVLDPLAGLRASPLARLVSTGSSRASSRSCVRRAG
jgi:hypothetical protein